MAQFIDCPECGLPSEFVDRMSMHGIDLGIITCISNHRFAAPIDYLVSYGLTIPDALPEQLFIKNAKDHVDQLYSFWQQNHDEPFDTSSLTEWIRTIFNQARPDDPDWQ